jgi:chromosome partitioning protein
MNMISEAPRPSLESLIQTQAQDLADQLAKHRFASFPPASAKSFRRLHPTETMRFLGITESYLRTTAAELQGPADERRRTYTLNDLAALRAAMAARSRNPHKFLPVRRTGERVQCISVVNFKGGSAKTTTAANLTQYLALCGYRTLAIDLDPQGSLTTLFGIAPEVSVAANETLYGMIRFDDSRVGAREVVRKTYIPNLDLIPAALELMEFEHEAPRALMNRGRGDSLALHRVAEGLADIEPDYDVIVIDCPPQLGYLTLSALIASTSVLITIHPQMLDVASMAQFLAMLGDLLATVAQAAGRSNVSYDWLRYLITRFEPGDGPQNQMAAFLRLIFGDYILKAPTLKSTAISDASITSQTIYEVERSQFTKATYDRALESVNAVNAEILGLITAAWGRE